MGWIFLAESAELPSQSVSGLDQSPIAKTIRTLRPSFFQEWRTAGYPSHQYGMMCGRSWAHLSQYLSTLSTAASRARISALQEMAAAWKASEVDYFSRSYALSAKFNRRSSSWKTCQLSLLEDLTESPQSFQRFGMIVDGEYYPLKTWERITNASDGSYLPTPSASSYGTNQGGAAGRVGKARPSLETMARHNLWPTPRATDADKGIRSPAGYAKERERRKNGSDLPTAVWATSTVCGNYNRKGASKNSGDGLQTQVGGQLNPNWVEWLMGYPSGWTELEGWAMQWFRSKRGKRSKDLAALGESENDIEQNV